MSSEYLTSLFSLAGKTAVITGATRGIGQTMAIALAKAGANIVLIQRDSSNTATLNTILALPPASSSSAPRAQIVECDLSISADVQALTARILALPSVPRIDILVNCGGIQRRHPAEIFPREDWEAVMQVNLDAVWTLCRDVGRHMLEDKEGREATGRGKIINIASLVSYQGGLTVPAYAAAKHAVLGITKAMSNEWSSKGVNVNAISPGYIDTDMNTALLANPTRSRQILERIPSGRWGAPSDFEGAIIFLASRASDYVCGEDLVVDGGWMGR